jgi:undecaprenyl diphosphate synthase
VTAWDNGNMSVATTDGDTLRHVIVVGGSLAEWEELPDDQWADRLAELGKVADHVGAGWLVVRPFGPVGSHTRAPAGGGAAPMRMPQRKLTVGSCNVVAIPDDDGRARLARTVASLQAAGSDITEATIDASINAPAEANPDLVVVVGAKHRMPPSLVWELAYSELVFVDSSWQHFGPAYLDEAFASYAQRHRRFGGID